MNALNNATLIVGPRHLTQHTSLNRRVFLYSYAGDYLCAHTIGRTSSRPDPSFKAIFAKQWAHLEILEPGD